MPVADGLRRSAATAGLVGLTCLVALKAGGEGVSKSESRQAAPDNTALAARLIAAYPDQLDRLDGDMLVWKDGTRMVFDDRRGGKDFDGLLNHADIKDQFALAYRPGPPAGRPTLNDDPGRFRNEAFFIKMYGDCGKNEVKPRLAVIDWLPRKGGGRLAVTTVNGVADKLKAVSAELDALPDTFNAFLVPSAGVYNCRTIAGSNLRSVHAYGAAIDINAGRANYWLWSKPDAKGRIAYHNRVPQEIVDIFERHGFIWGGKWYHYDTMHFEYRPELLAELLAADR